MGSYIDFIDIAYRTVSCNIEHFDAVVHHAADMIGKPWQNVTDRSRDKLIHTKFI